MFLALITALAGATDITHSGRALDAFGEPVDGAVAVEISLWTAASGGSEVWDQAFSPVLESGFYTLTLSSDADGDDVGDVIAAHDALWMEVSVDGVGQGDRQPVTTVPRAVVAERLAGSSAGDGSTAFNAGRNCKDILDAHSPTRNGLYWIDPDGDGFTTDAFRTWCDMTGGGWTLVMQNNHHVRSDALDPAWRLTISAAHVRGGALSDDLGTFDLLVGLGMWADIGTEGRLTMGDVPGTIERTATFASLTVDANDNYRIAMTAPVLSGTTVSPGLYVGHNNQTWKTIDNGNTCPASYGHPWWYTSCWSGSLWGSDRSHSPRAYWTSSTVGSNSFEWGALWLR